MAQDKQIPFLAVDVILNVFLSVLSFYAESIVDPG
jgi:hypothetical protein